MKKLLLLTLLWVSQTGLSQFNDTLFYQSGNFKVVEIIKRTADNIEYKYITDGGDTTSTASPLFLFSHYVCYDNENILQYSTSNDSQKTQSQTRDLTTSSFTLSPYVNFNLGLGISYNFTFGETMRWTWTNRLHYSIVFLDFEDHFGSMFFTSRINYTPIYRKKFAWSFGLSPTAQLFFDQVNKPTIYLPVNTTLEFLIRNAWSFEINLGMGIVYLTKTSNFYKYPGANIDLGFVKRFGKTKTISLKDSKMK